MRKFRDRQPARRVKPTKKPRTNWTAHKPDLQTDFNNHCGYCHSYDGFRNTYYEVDHFVPKELIKKNNWAISLVTYSNLVYSCKFCNNNKLNIWPSNSPTVFRIRSKGFVDPCNIDYDKHFYRTNKGAIKGKTPLGKWMATKAFKFDERERSIIVLWNLNTLRKIIEELEIQLSRNAINSRKYNSIKVELERCAYEYVKFDKELIEFYNNL